MDASSPQAGGNSDAAEKGSDQRDESDDEPLFDTAAAASDSSEEDEEEDEDEDALREAGLGFIADDDDDDEGEEEADADDDGHGERGSQRDGQSDEPSSPRKKKKRKRKRHRSNVIEDLDEDDLRLLEENTGKQFKRKKRLFKHQDEAGPRGREGLAEAFGTADLDGVEDLIDQVGPAEDVAPLEAVGYDAYEGGSDDEMGDFIEHDGVRGSEYRAHRRALGAKARAAGMSLEAYQELLEMLGTDAQTAEILSAWENQMLDDDDADGMAEDLLDEGDVAADGDGAKASSQPAADPTLLAQYQMTARDDELRQADMPERLYVAREAIRDGMELSFDSMTEHIYDALFAEGAPEQVLKWLLQDGVLEVEGVAEQSVEALQLKYEGMERLGSWATDGAEAAGGRAMLTQSVRGFRLLRRQRFPAEMEARRVEDGLAPSWTTIEDWRRDDAAQEAVRGAIRALLFLVFQRNLDIPTVAMFRKELLGELLVTRPDEVPHVVTLEMSERFKERDVHIVPGAVLPGGRCMRRWDVVYGVFDEALRYLQLQQQKDTRQAQLQRSKLEEEAKDDMLLGLGQARTAQDLEDWKVRLDVLEAAVPATLSTLSLDDDSGAADVVAPKRLRRYTRLMHEGYGDLAALLVMSDSDFAMNAQTIDEDNPLGLLALNPPAVADTPEHIAEAFMDDRGLQPSIRAMATRGIGRVHVALSNASACAIEQISSNPQIRAVVRGLYMRFATISTVPTDAGELELTPFTQLGQVKRLVNKPVEACIASGDQYLRILAAEAAGLIKVTIHVPAALAEGEVAFAQQREMDPPALLSRVILDPFRQLYTGSLDDDGSDLYRFRAAIVDAALHEHLLKHAHTACLRQLERTARAAALDEIGGAFWFQIDESARQEQEADGMADLMDDVRVDASQFLQDQRVCVVVHGMLHQRNLQDATHMVMLDGRGYPIDHVLLPQLSGRIRKNPPMINAMAEVEHKAADVGRICKFLRKHWPHLIVVGASNVFCQQLAEDMKEICEKDFTQTEKNSNLAPLSDFTVRTEKEDVAALYEVCAFAQRDLKDCAPRVRRGVALGRHCIEPLATLAALAEPAWELLALSLHPMQSSVPEVDRKRVLDQLLCTAVAHVGVNINSAAQTDWLVPMLAYVPGLGPRKAAQLVKGIRSLPEYDDDIGFVPGQTVLERGSLLKADVEQLEDDEERSGAAVLPLAVYQNAAPFLRTFDAVEVESDLWREREELTKERLRFQPRDEPALREIAFAACEDAGVDDTSPIVVHKATQAPLQVVQVDLSLFDERWQAEHPGKASRLATFLDLAFELVDGFRDGREMTRMELDRQTEFYAYTNEDALSLQVGRVLSTTARYVGPNFARLETDSGMECILFRRNVSSNPPETLEAVLAVGQTLRVRVLDIAFEEQTPRIEVGSRSDHPSSDNAHWEGVYLAEFDPFYRVVTEQDRKEMEEKKEADNKHVAFIARPIKHARFANMSTARAEEVLTMPDFGGEARFADVFRPEGPQDGDAIFHPSNKGADRIQLSVRLFCKREPLAGNQPVVEHLDVLEVKKRKGDHLVLGTPLVMARHFRHLDPSVCEFEDMDEILQRFVEPYVQNFQAVLNHRKFADGPRRRVDDEVVRAVAERGQPDWRFGLCRGENKDDKSDSVGYGYIAYQLRPGPAVQRFFFLVSHRGFYLSLKPEPSISCTSLAKVETVFKRHMKKMLEAARSRRAAPAPPPAPEMLPPQGVPGPTRHGYGYSNGGAPPPGNYGQPGGRPYPGPPPPAQYPGPPGFAGQHAQAAHYR